MFNVQMLAPELIRPNPHNARTHSKRQIREIERSINAFGFANPLLVDDGFGLIAGHGRLEAAKNLQMSSVPVIVLSGLSGTKKRALALADNKIAEKAGWDRERLAVELPELSELLTLEDLDISLTGFEAVEIDQLVTDFEPNASDPADEVDLALMNKRVVSRPGDLWQLGKSRLLCGSALDPTHVKRLMQGDQAAVAFLDVPYNVKVSAIVGRGRIKHSEFAMASGEMSRPAFETFLTDALREAAAVSRPGAVHYVCMDWRSVAELVAAGRQAYGDMLNLIVWVKTNAGQGSFYRSQHELIGVFRVEGGPQRNNVELGKHGRNRSNVWRYAGVNSFGSDRLNELSVHPTVKPVAMIADALKDCSKPGDIVLDTFCGSGSTILAAERVGRRGFGIELEPRFVDVAIRRWQAFARKDAVQIETGLTFDEVSAKIPPEAFAPMNSAQASSHDVG